METKLNLGCGKLPIDGYRNIDISNGENAYPLSYIENESCDEIRASHILEHFSKGQLKAVLVDWISKLKTGGVLKIAVPDFKKITEEYIKAPSAMIAAYVMGSQLDEYDYHKSIFDEFSLRELLESLGISEIKTWQDGKDTCQLPISLNLQGIKTTKKLCRKKVHCVLSAPRLGFTANYNCMIRELAMRGIEVTVGTGAFWSQVLTRTIEQNYKNCDYILALDYDTWFKHEHLLKMLELAELTDADVIIPNQIKRESDSVLIKLDGNKITKDDYDTGAVLAQCGHFGCTLFKASCFDKLNKPWLQEIPDPNGSWNDGRVDSDIYFWGNCIKSGLKVLFAPKIRIGHIQQMCTFAGKYEDGFKPVHVTLQDLEDKKIPDFILGELNEN